MLLVSNIFSFKKYQTWIFTNSGLSKKATKISFYVLQASHHCSRKLENTILINVCLPFTFFIAIDDSELCIEFLLSEVLSVCFKCICLRS